MGGFRAGQPEFEQPSWRAETVINAGQVHFSKAPPEEPAALPSAAADPGFRRTLARLLLRKLTSTIDEVQWLDTELIDRSALVEDVDGRPVTGRRGGLLRRRRAPVRPLPHVLAHPDTDLILLQGGPGSGKSIALLHHALSQLKHIADGRTPNAPLPLYVNLRELRAKPHEMTTAVLQQYIQEQTGPRGSADVAAYFAHHFLGDLRNRRVILLLDSFDEIPAVYGSATIDETVAPYVDTVIELVGGGGRCVVAAREYKGPRASGWTRLQLLGLTPEQQEDFIRRLRLDESQLSLVRPLLTDRRRGFAALLGNPLHLRLLATYVQARHAMPERPSELFAEFAAGRLREALPETDTDPDTDPETAGRTTALRRDVEDFLSHLAFMLTAAGRGLSLDERSYQEEISRQTGGDPATRDLVIRTLIRSRILRTSLVESSGAEGVRSVVFFGHRRVLEYFASRYVAEHPSALSSQELATNGRWRETAVAVLQDSTPDVTRPLLEALAEVLTAEQDRAGRPGAAGFEWSPQAVHCLELLTTAYQGRPDRSYELVQPLAEELVATAWERGSVSDRKFALDCLPVLSETARQTYIDSAFAGDSDWLRRTALRDCATLPALSPTVQASIRRLLITRLGEPSSAAERHALDVDLQQLCGDEDFVALRRVIDRTPRRVGWLGAISAVAGLAALRNDQPWFALGVPVLAVTLTMAFFWIFQASKPLSYGPGRNLPHRALAGIESRAGASETAEVLSWLFLCSFWMAAMGLLIGVAKVTPRPVGDIADPGLVGAALALESLALAWGPSVLYAVHRGRSARELRVTGLLCAVPYAVRGHERQPREWRGRLGWLAGAVITYGVLHLLDAITSVIVNVIVNVINVIGIVWTVIFGLVMLTSLSRLLKPVVIALSRELPRQRRLNRAFQNGSSGGPAFFSALFELREAREAADYVRRVRTVPRGDPLRLDRRTLRLCIARLQGAATGDPALDIPPAGAVRLAKWEGSAELLDELGRLDEQLRAR